MVVLSAYYLFTEDVDQLEFTSTGTKPGNEISISTNEHSTPTADSKAAETKTEVKTDAKVDATAKQDASAKQDGAAATDTKGAQASDAKSTAAEAKTDNASASDAKVLEKVQTQATSGSDYFVGQQLKRNEEMGKQTEKLLTIISDSKQNTDAVAKAYEELRKLEDKEAKITSLEESLMKDFPQAIVNEESGKWKVTVQSNKLERSQAVSIIDKVMKEMSVGADSIVVQYKP
jgi:stage III sporulation protein AH